MGATILSVDESNRPQAIALKPPKQKEPCLSKPKLLVLREAPGAELAEEAQRALAERPQRAVLIASMTIIIIISIIIIITITIAVLVMMTITCYYQ